MKNNTVFLGQILVLVCIIWALILGPAQVAATNQGEKADHWSRLNPQTISLVGTYPAGSYGLYDVAFDGANIWVARGPSDNVTKLRASDGAILGTYPVGNDPRNLAFDGTNIWVANFISDNVTKLRASDGALLGTYPVGDGPSGLAFDGANIWVVNLDSDNVTKLRASDGALLDTFPVGNAPTGLAFDGTYMWVANYYDGNVMKLYQAPEPGPGPGDGGGGTVEVGGEVYPVNKLSVLAPWILLVAAIIPVATIVIRRRRAQS